MSRNRAPLWVLGLFLAQMLFAGVHALEHVEAAHDCAHHDSSGFDGSGEAEHELEAHLACLYCKLADSNAATFDGVTLVSSCVVDFGAVCVSQVEQCQINWLSAHPLRGPPIFV